MLTLLTFDNIINIHKLNICAKFKQTITPDASFDRVRVFDFLKTRVSIEFGHGKINPNERTTEPARNSSEQLVIEWHF